MSKKYPLLDDKEWLEKKYLEERLSPRKIAKIVGCSRQPVGDALRRLDIPLRSRSEAQKQLQAGEKHPMFGKHHSEETRKKILKKYGWKMIVFWQDDLEQEDAEKHILRVLKEEKAI